MNEFYGFKMAVPQSDQDLARSLGVWLRHAGAVADTAPCIIVLDALNQLDSGSGQAGAEHDLLWIPRVLPQGVTLVLSTLPGRVGFIWKFCCMCEKIWMDSECEMFLSFKKRYSNDDEKCVCVWGGGGGNLQHRSIRQKEGHCFPYFPLSDPGVVLPFSFIR